METIAAAAGAMPNGTASKFRGQGLELAICAELWRQVIVPDGAA